MLQALSIENVVLIKRLDLVFEKGLTVLTGETGAGKSILLDALYLALGERADTSLIRWGEKEAIITATFSLSFEKLAIKEFFQNFLESWGLCLEEPTLILRRHIMREGPSRAFINDRPITVATLKMIASQLLDIHGQFDRLLEPHDHRALLDDYGQHASLLKELGACHKAWREAEMRCAEAQASRTQKSQRLAFLTMALEDLQFLSYTPGEELTLEQDRLTASHFNKLQDLGRTVYDRLYGARSAENLLTDALVALDKMHNLTPDLFRPLAIFLERCHVELQEYAPTLKEFCESTNTYNLESIDQRLYDLKAMARKYGVEVTQLSCLYQSLRAEKESLIDTATSLDTLHDEIKTLKAHYETVAGKLTQARHQAAKLLEEAVKEQLEDLKLERASIKFDFMALNPEQWNQFGTERIILMVKMNEGSLWGPLAKVASGGERSRLMLALKTVLNQGSEDFTQIFDEIDMGMSGAAAASVGSALKKLSAHHQIITITHAPQVAAIADHHWRVQKYDQDGQTLTTIEILKGAERVEEVARLLSGDIITPEAKLAALALFPSSSLPAA